MALKRTLVPYDGSEPSKRALEKAVELAKLTEKMQLVLLQVIPEIPVPPMSEKPIRSMKTVIFVTMSAYLKEVYQDMKSEALKMLSDKKHKNEKDAGIQVEIKAVIGYPSDKIVEYVGDHRIDLIVMGTTSLKGIAKIKSLGSVARNVSERSECPVMLVH